MRALAVTVKLGPGVLMIVAKDCHKVTKQHDQSLIGTYLAEMVLLPASCANSFMHYGASQAASGMFLFGKTLSGLQRVARVVTSGSNLDIWVCNCLDP